MRQSRRDDERLYCGETFRFHWSATLRSERVFVIDLTTATEDSPHFLDVLAENESDLQVLVAASGGALRFESKDLV